MRRVNPAVTASPYWEFHIEEAVYKNEWSRMSPLFKDDTFGPVATRPEDGYVLLGGRFGKMPVARDLGEVYAEFEPGVSLRVGWS